MHNEADHHTYSDGHHDAVGKNIYSLHNYYDNFWAILPGRVMDFVSSGPFNWSTHALRKFLLCFEE